MKIFAELKSKYWIKNPDYQKICDIGRPISILFLVLIHSSLLFSQNTANKLIREVAILATRNAGRGLTYNDIEGSPYYSEPFINSTVFLIDGNYATLPLRYDMYQDEMEFQRDGEIYWVTKKDIQYIQYGTEMMVPELFADNLSKPVYFFVMVKGRNSLYIRKKVSFYPYVPPQAFADSKPDRFETDQDEYFLKQEGMPVKKISSKKVLSEILSENTPALDFIKKSKININKAEDLLELVKFLNTQ